MAFTDLEKTPITGVLNRKAVLILTLLPLIFLIFFVAQYSINIPQGDQWDFIPTLDKFFCGELTLADIWGQHCEHRLFFPRIIMLFLANLTNWDTRYEMFFSLLLAVVLLMILFYTVKNRAPGVSMNALYMALPVISFLYFSLSQWENWLWGWQIAVFCSVFFAISGIILLSHQNLSWLRLFFAYICALISFFSFANGIVFLLVGIFIILAHPLISKKRKITATTLWLMGSVLAVLLYMQGYTQPDHADVFAFLKNPLGSAVYVLKFIGAPLAWRNSAIWGLGGLFLFAYLLLRLYREKRALTNYLASISISLYGLGCACLHTIGRADFGTSQAMSSRYLSFSNWFWIGLILALVQYTSENTAQDFSRTDIVPSYIYISALFVVFLAFFSEFPHIGFIKDLSETLKVVFLGVIVKRAISWSKKHQSGHHINHATMALIFLSISFQVLLLQRQQIIPCQKYQEKLLEAKKQLIEKGIHGQIDMLYPPGRFGIEPRLPLLKKHDLSIYRNKPTE
jgi:hypothetical protein